MIAMSTVTDPLSGPANEWWRTDAFTLIFTIIFRPCVSIINQLIHRQSPISLSESDNQTVTQDRNKELLMNLRLLISIAQIKD